MVLLRPESRYVPAMELPTVLEVDVGRQQVDQGLHVMVLSTTTILQQCLRLLILLVSAVG